MTKIFPELFPAGTQGTKTAGYYMNAHLHTNLELIKKVIKKDWDFIILVDGAEGSGKSVLAQQMAYLCDPTLTLDRIVFRPDKFTEAVVKAQKYQSIVFDEAYSGMSSRAAMSMINKSLVAMLAEIRQKNLFIFIVMPTFFDMDRYVALWRSRALVHVYTNGFERGYFKFYNYKRKKNMYVIGKKYYSYAQTQPNFYGRFTDFYPMGDKEYRHKKNDSLNIYTEADAIKQTKEQIQIEVRTDIAMNLKYIQKYVKFTNEQIGEIMGVSKHAIGRYIRSANAENKDSVADVSRIL